RQGVGAGELGAEGHVVAQPVGELDPAAVDVEAPALPVDLDPDLHARGLGGRGVPGVRSWTECRPTQETKYSVFQSGPPKHRLFVWVSPCATIPRCLPVLSKIQIPPEPPQ